MYLQNKNNKHSLQNNIVIFQLLNGKTSANNTNVQTLTKTKENEKSTFTVI